MTINVTSVNDAPAGTDKTVTRVEDTAYTFARAGLRLHRPQRQPGQRARCGEDHHVPGAGTLTLTGVARHRGRQVVSVANINAGQSGVHAGPSANAAGYASFTFQVQDDGGTANGGVDLDQTPNTITINVTSVNDAPAGTDNTVTTN